MVARHRAGPGLMAGAVLAGGKATRYGGRPKGLLRLGDGRTIIEREVAELRAAGVEDIVVVANEAVLYERCGGAVIQDVRPGMGPLSGIEAALARSQGRCDSVLFLPCDLPAITAKEIAALASAFADGAELVAVVVTGDSFWQPLCAVVHNDAVPAVSRALDEGRRTVREVWQDLGAAEVQFGDSAPFFNVNSPEELARWRAQVEHKPCPRP